MTRSVETTSSEDSELSLPAPKERRRLREAAELTHDEVAAAVGVTAATVRSWESGRTDPRGRKRELYTQFLARLSDRPQDGGPAGAPGEAKTARAAEEPAADPPVPDRPTPDGPTSDTQAPDRPALDRPTPDRPAPDRPTADAPTSDARTEPERLPAEPPRGSRCRARPRPSTASTPSPPATSPGRPTCSPAVGRSPWRLWRRPSSRPGTGGPRWPPTRTRWVGCARSPTSTRSPLAPLPTRPPASRQAARRARRPDPARRPALAVAREPPYRPALRRRRPRPPRHRRRDRGDHTHRGPPARARARRPRRPDPRTGRRTARKAVRAAARPVHRAATARRPRTAPGGRRPRRRRAAHPAVDPRDPQPDGDDRRLDVLHAHDRAHPVRAPVGPRRERLRGPPLAGPQQLTERGKQLHDKLRADPQAGPARIAPRIE